MHGWLWPGLYLYIRILFKCNIGKQLKHMNKYYILYKLGNFQGTVIRMG